ncbi:MAG TPA: response regulator [Clostridiaceae bacterium]|nr:response regulator [Clostridiaceae bacterium]
MTINIGICDDSGEDIRILSKALYEYDPSFQILAYTNGESLLSECEEKRILFDIIFLDIYMPAQNGIEIARKLRETMKDVKLVFITSSNEHYPDAYDLFAFNYILKPLNTEKLNKILDRALADIAGERHQQISFKYKSTNYRVYCKDILYIESRDKTIYFYMADKSILQCYGKLDGIYKQLPEDLFIRCHQSYIVNISHITEVAESHFMVGKVAINISKKYIKDSKDKYFTYLFERMNIRGQFHD